MLAPRSLYLCLFAVVLVAACTSSGELSSSDVQSLWNPDTLFYDADMRIDTETETYVIEAGYGRLIYDGAEKVLAAWGHGLDDETGFTIRIPFSEVRRIWYNTDLLLQMKDSSKHRLESGAWYMAVENGRVTSLVSLLTKSGALSGRTQEIEASLTPDDIRSMTVPVKESRSAKTILIGTGILVAGIIAFFVIESHQTVTNTW